MFLLIGIGLAALYGALSAVGVAASLKGRKIHRTAAFIMIVFGILVILSAFLNWMTVLIISLLVLQITAVINGFHMYGKINILHHFIRLTVSVMIIFLVI